MGRLKELYERHVVLEMPEGGFANEDPRFSSEELDPVPKATRAYSALSFMSFWCAELFNASQLSTSSAAVSLGLNPGMAVLACFVGNCMVSVPCAISGYLGANYGINFPVTARGSFGLRGAYWAMVVRCVPCVIYYGIQCSLAGTAVQAMIEAIWPSFKNWHTDAFPASANISAQGLIGFVIFWLASLPFFYIPIPKLHYLYMAKTAIIPLLWTALMTWALTASKGWSAAWTAPSKPQDGYTSGYLFAYCINGAISGIATLSVNIMDISRHCRSPKSATIPGLVAIPIVTTLTELLGAVMAVSSTVVFGTMQWNPLLVIIQFENRAGKFFAAAAFVFINIMTNLTGNTIPFANDLMGMFPKYINIRRGQYICAILGFIICPWKILAEATTFLGFLSGYTLFLGALTGIIFTDHFLIRRGYGFHLYHLYKPHGIYWYYKGVNWRAILAFFIAIAPFFPGLLHAMGVNVKNRGALNLYSLNWLLVIVFAALIYYGLYLISPIPITSDDDDTGKLFLNGGIIPIDGEEVPTSLDSGDEYAEKEAGHTKVLER